MWTKLGDEAPDEYADLSDAAFRTHIEALCWSNRRLLDLRIPKRDLRRFAFSEGTEQAAKELVACSCGSTAGMYGSWPTAPSGSSRVPGSAAPGPAGVTSPGIAGGTRQKPSAPIYRGRTASVRLCGLQRLRRAVRRITG